MAVLSEDGNIALRQEIAEINEELQMSGEEAGRESAGGRRN